MTREESAEERTAGRRLQPSHVFFFFVPLLLFSLDEVGEDEDRPLSPFVW